MIEMKNVSLRILKVATFEIESASQRVEALRNNLSQQAWALKTNQFADVLAGHLSFALDSCKTLKEKIEEALPDRSVTAQRLIEDIHKLIAFVQGHEQLFDDLETNYSLDEMLSIAAYRIKEHADIMFAKSLGEKMK